MKKLMLIANPFSGHGFAKFTLFDVVQTFCKAGYAVTVFMPNPEEQLTISKIVTEQCNNYDLVVCMGGDGTLSDTAGGLMVLENRPPLGYIPMGSTNDMATTLSMPKQPAAAAQAVLDGIPQPHDMGYYDGKYFTYVAAFGAFTAVSYMTPQKSKNTFGHAAYIFEALGQLPEIKPVKVRVEYDDGVIEGLFMFGAVANSTSVAGIFKLNSDIVNLDDGLFEILLIREPEDLAGLGDIINNIMTKTYVSDKIVLLHTAKARFLFETPVPWTRDGENGGEYTDITLENIHQAIQFIKYESD